MDIPNKRYVYGKEARTLLREGVKALADSVVVTLGARGQNVIFETAMFQKPIITNDGVTIAREGKLEDPIPNMAMQIIKQASFRTNDLAGDGTTTTIVLADAIIEAAFNHVDQGVSSVQMRKSLEKYTQLIIDELKKKAHLVKNVDEACQIATISCQDEKIGRMLGSLVFELGLFGSVDLTEGKENGVSVARERGYRIDNGVKEGHWFNRKDGEWGPKLDEAKLLISNDPIENSGHFLEFLGSFVEADNSGKIEKVVADKLLIVAESLSTEVLQILFGNGKTAEGGFLQWAWIQPPKFGERRKQILYDLAAATGGCVIDKEQGNYLNRLTVDDLGTASFVANKEQTVIKSSDENGVRSRIEEIQNAISSTKSEVEIGELRKRIACLNGEMATVSYNAPTDADKRELKLRLEDALSATKAALEEGYLPGGGVALMNARQALDVVKPETPEDKIALSILLEVCTKPFFHILNNADFPDIEELIADLSEKDGVGVDVLTGEQVVMVRNGIIDPLKVVRLALLHAVSSAGVLMTTGCAVMNVPKEEDKK